MAAVAVVGGGVGGLAAAIRLAAAGHGVVVTERNSTVGGKLAAYSRDGFTFETGPSLLTLPSVFDDLLGLAGRSLASTCIPILLDPAISYRFADGSHFATRSSPAATVAEVEAFSPGSGREWERFAARGARVWDVSSRTFFAGPMESPAGLARRLRSPSDLLAIDAMRCLAGRAARSFDDLRLRQWAARYATYAGSSPYRAPATLSCIPWLEQAFGCWYLAGGLQTLATALQVAAEALGVSIRTGVSVTQILACDGRVTGVVADDCVLPADVVISDVDAHHLYADLLPDRRRLRRTERAGLSSSGFVILAAVDGTTPGLTHHNVTFSADYRREFSDIFDRSVAPSDPTIYACVSARTDPSQAPAGCENWFVLVNVPAGAETDDVYRDHVLEVMASRGWDLAGRLRWTETITPATLESRYRCPGGAIYGSSSNGRRAAFLRAANRGPVAGLYLVGGSAHPGGGLPLVALGAGIVTDMVASDFGALRSA